jgi:hypothetical protein
MVLEVVTVDQFGDTVRVLRGDMKMVLVEAGVQGGACVEEAVEILVARRVWLAS